MLNLLKIDSNSSNIEKNIKKLSVQTARRTVNKIAN